MARKPLTESELDTALVELPAWELRDGKLHRELAFDDFAQAFGFMASMALVSEAMNHHPDWSNVYSRVTIDLSTHDAGAVTALDVEWARAAEARLPRLGGG